MDVSELSYDYPQQQTGTEAIGKEDHNKSSSPDSNIYDMPVEEEGDSIAKISDICAKRVMSV